ncbi:MAG: shikimate dehydrogenase [Cryomorphaceae bacterium]|jgi:shikimate dehydrogenase
MKHVYTIDDLRENTLPVNAKLAVLGYPVSHSASPQMHQAALNGLGIDATYIRLEIEPGNVTESFELMQSLGFIGCNVTIPHKLEAMECCDELSASVKALGVANTIHFKDGKIIGDNTDGPGLIKALEEDFGLTVRGANVLVLGAGGGAGKAISTQLNREGCANLYLSNRTVSKLEKMAENLQLTQTRVHLLGNSSAELEAIAGDVQIIINATSMGMKPDDGLPIPAHCLTAQHKVYDAIYNPPLTSLLASASDRGAAVANGLSMLIHQGAISFEIWTGKHPDTALMQNAISA